MNDNQDNHAIPLIIDSQSGWVHGARHVPSPNHGPRPPGAGIDTIVLHNISLPPGEFGGEAIEALFSNKLDFDSHPYYQRIRGLQVSTHFLVRRHGAVVQFVSTRHMAWHAGRSLFYGRERVNDFSIGIEVEGSDDMPFDHRQMPVLADLVTALMLAYPQTGIERLCGHSDIAPGRKTDPGPYFDWSTLRQCVCNRLSAKQVT